MTKIIGEIKEEIIVNKINVAIVDDNERMLTLLENILNEDSDISVIGKGGDGLQALDLIHKKEAGLYCDFCHRPGKYYGRCLCSGSELLYHETF